MSAARLIARWTGRVVWRERRQYTAMFALILVAGAASISAALFAFHTTPPPERDHAGGQLEVTASDDPDALMARLTASGVPFARVDRATLSVEATSQRVDTRVLNAENPVASPWLSVVHGRLPTDPGEVAVTDRATLDDLTVGGELTLDRRSARVVGIVENPTDLGDEFAIVTALDRFPDAVISTSFLVDADAGVVDSIVGGGGEITTSDSGSRSSSALLMVAVTTIGMLEVALLVGLGFAVAARRRTVEFGTLAAIGATPRQLRTAGTMVGLMIGGVGAAAGAALGVAVAAGALTRLETQIGHRIDPTVPWWIVVFNVAIAVGAGAIVSRRPLTAMARQPVVDLLRAARPPVDRSWRSAVVGAAVVAAGILALGVGFSSLDLLTVALGTILTPVGFMLVAPIASVAVARLTGAGIASRLAARTIARDHRRSGAVAAALAMALAVPVAIGVVSASVDAGHDDRGPNLAPNSFAVWHPGASETGSRIPALLDQEALADAESRLAGSVEGLSFARVEVAVPDDAVHERWDFSELGTREAVEPLLAGRAYDGRCLDCDVYSFADDDDAVSEWTVDGAWIANEQLLGAVGIDADDLADTDAVVRSDGYGMLGPSGPIGDVAVADDWPHLSRVPPLLVSPDALGDGDTALPIGFIVTTEQPLARNERDVVRSVVGDGLTLEFHQPPEPSSGLRAIALMSGALLGLALVAGAIGLLNDELEPDRRLLTQMGATPRQLRRLGASLAAQLGIAGAALGLVIGCSALVPLRAIDDSTLPLAVPWAPLVTLAVGFPITAAVVGWIGSGRASASPSASRQLGD